MTNIIRYTRQCLVRYNNTKYIVFVFLLACTIIGGFLWPYTINTWLVFSGKPPSITFWHGALLGLCPMIGQITIPIAVITCILMLFLV